jgi:hypothetical protein
MHRWALDGLALDNDKCGIYIYRLNYPLQVPRTGLNKCRAIIARDIRDAVFLAKDPGSPSYSH